MAWRARLLVVEYNQDTCKRCLHGQTICDAVSTTNRTQVATGVRNLGNITYQARKKGARNPRIEKQESRLLSHRKKCRLAQQNPPVQMRSRGISSPPLEPVWLAPRVYHFLASLQSQERKAQRIRISTGENTNPRVGHRSR